MTKKELESKAIQDKIASLKKYFINTNDETQKIPLDSFINVVSKIMEVSKNEATLLITDGDITVNGNLVVDPNFVLKSNDVIRGYTGHFQNNTKYIAIIS